ncbi:ABC transporter ATP-binding protein/permease [Amycolatopsis sp. NBC_01307]|uniref:ABC transporter ATP-binding protein n=1 Tax=Amycolatopsis sp. NBC_01307 TaxID=2903561 RepID=UPI002E1244D3|nr:ABC transporter ATP-binding protein/permease [Amycolatopsis sp. NBC_01307]
MSLRRLYWSALTGQWRGGVVLLVCSVLEGLPAFFSGRLVELSVDRGFAVGDPRTGLGWLALFGLAAVLGAFGSRMVWHQLGKVVEPLRDALVTAVVRGVLHDESPPRNQPDSSGVARITQHVEVVRDATAGLLVQARAMLVTTTSALAGLVTVAGALVLPVAVPVVASLVVFGCLLPSLARRQRALALADEHTAATAGASLAGMRDVVACGAEPIAALAMYHAVDAQATAAIRVARSSALRSLVISLGGFAPLLLALWLAPGLVATGELTAGAALGALVYLATTMQPALRGLAATAGTVVLRLLVALRRLAETAELPERPDGTATPRSIEVRVRALTFGWGATAEPVVRGLDLGLRPGEHLAVVGPSGIGKSTLAGLLTGMLTPQEGRVLVGGVPVRDVPRALRHELVALIPQEAYVFAGTVRDNVALFAPSASDDALAAAATAVGAGALLKRLGGLDAEIGHGGEGISAGEAQLLALARVYAGSARFVILDEATSHLDPVSEARAERAFAARGGVLVVIAHRLSSALRANRVLVMDGRETAVGKHADLLARSPRYAELMQAWATPVAGGAATGDAGPAAVRVAGTDPAAAAAGGPAGAAVAAAGSAGGVETAAVARGAATVAAGGAASGAAPAAAGGSAVAASTCGSASNPATAAAFTGDLVSGAAPAAAGGGAAAASARGSGSSSATSGAFTGDLADGAAPAAADGPVRGATTAAAAVGGAATTAGELAGGSAAAAASAPSEATAGSETPWRPSPVPRTARAG